MAHSKQMTISSNPSKPKKQKLHKCRVCKSPYLKRSIGHIACGGECAQKVAEMARNKALRSVLKSERDKDSKRRDALKSRSDWIADVQIAFNRFVRARDADQTCICCGKPFEPQKVGGSVDAGHYRSRGSAPHLRFDERNCHAQRKNCNRPGGTTHAAFRLGMIARIGLEALEALEADQESRDWSIDDLRDLKALYQLKFKEITKSR